MGATFRPWQRGELRDARDYRKNCVDSLREQGIAGALLGQRNLKGHAANDNENPLKTAPPRMAAKRPGGSPEYRPDCSGTPGCHGSQG